MSTSEDSPVTSPASAAPDARVEGPGLSSEVFGGSLAREIERLANQIFSSFPGATPPGVGVPETSAPAPVVPGPLRGPNALAVGAGGASPAVTLPPVPGMLKSPPLSVAPAPKEGDLRAIPAMFAETAGASSPLAFAGTPEPAAPAPYFLGLAGLPSAQAPSSPSLDLSHVQGPAGPAWAAAPGIPTSVPLVSSPASARLPESTPSAASPERSVSQASASQASDRSSTPGSARFTPEVDASSHAPGEIYDANAVRRDFPILRERIHGKPLVWLDNAATTQKPQSVIDRLSYFYEHENSNIHRAAHTLAARATDAYEGARETSRRFLNAPSSKNIVFVRGTTEAINLVAQSWGRRNIGPGDEIVITWLEHHANIIPWQMLCREKGARLCVAPVDDDGQVILEEYERLLSPRTKLVAFGQVSNALGTIVPAREMIAIAHRYGARVLVDGAQAVSHLRVDTQSLDCDFYCFSGHKIFGPTGIGVLYGKSDVLEAMPPWQGGGNMIDTVTFEKTTYRSAPDRFEAGTGNIADAVGLGAALDYVTSIGLENIARHEHELLEYATGCLTQIPGFHLLGTAPDKAAVISFALDGHRPEDVGAALNRDGIAVRAGHHCAQPILRRFGYEATVRASLAPYNTRSDVDALVAALKRLQAGHPGT